MEPIWYLQKGPIDAELAQKMRPLAQRFFQLCDKFQVDRPQEWRDDTETTRQRIRGVLGVAEGEAL